MTAVAIYLTAPITKPAKADDRKQETNKTAQINPVTLTAASIELLAGNETATLDTKLTVPLPYGFKVFNRNRITTPYDEKTIGTTHVLNLAYTLFDNLNVITETDIGTTTPIQQRIGLEYKLPFPEGSLYTTAHVAMRAKTDVFWLTNISYNPAIYESLQLVTNVENVTTINATGHMASSQRIRLGLGIGPAQFGGACDLTEKGNEGKFSYNCGGFVKIVK